MPPKQVVVVMQQNYPFGQCEECTTESTKVLVRKIYKIKSQERRKILQKMSILRKLKNDYLIKIESVLQQEDCIHLLFQYIPIKLQTWISNINDQFIQNFRDQLIQLSEYLANYSIVTDFQLKNVGMDQDYGAKYFLDLNFQTNTSINRQKLKSNYLKQINNLFKPYILTNKDTKTIQKKEKDTDISNFERSNKSYTKEVEKSNNSYVKQTERTNKSYVKQVEKTKKQPVDSSISPPTNKSIQNKHKQKALQKYYQEVNMSVDSENQKILQEFMDVLDNEEETSPKNILPSPGKNKSQLFTPSQPNSMQKKSNNNNNQTPYFHANQQNNSYQQKPSFMKFQKNSSQQNQSLVINQSQPLPAKNYVQQNQYNSLSNNLIPLNASNQYTKAFQKGRKSENNDDQRDKWRQSINLQSRVSSVIEKSREVIKKFKSVKVSPSA